MKYWERGDRLYDLSRRINVGGTQNVIDAALASKAEMVVSTSSGIVSLPYHNLLNVFSKRSYRLSDKVEFPEPVMPSVYIRSKRESEQVVRQAHGKSGLKTVAIRASHGVRSPKGFSYDLMQKIQKDPTHKDLTLNFAHSYICVQDLAASHLCAEDALRRDVAGVGGGAFLVTGKNEQTPLTFRDNRKIWHHYLGKGDIKFEEHNNLVIYIVAQCVEKYLFLCSLFNYKPNLGELEMNQPALWSVISTDVVTDDSRAKALLNYKPQWTAEQTMKWCVETFQQQQK